MSIYHFYQGKNENENLELSQRYHRWLKVGRVLFDT